jgi:hypothetical protein
MQLRKCAGRNLEPHCSRDDKTAARSRPPRPERAIAIPHRTSWHVTMPRSRSAPPKAEPRRAAARDHQIKIRERHRSEVRPRALRRRASRDCDGLHSAAGRRRLHRRCLGPCRSRVSSKCASAQHSSAHRYATGTPTGGHLAAYGGLDSGWLGGRSPLGCSPLRRAFVHKKQRGR